MNCCKICWYFCNNSHFSAWFTILVPEPVIIHKVPGSAFLKKQPANTEIKCRWFNFLRLYSKEFSDVSESATSWLCTPTSRIQKAKWMCLGDAKLSVARRNVHLFRDLVSSCCLSLFTNSCFWNLLHSCHPSTDSEIILPTSCLCFFNKTQGLSDSESARCTTLLHRLPSSPAPFSAHS